MNGYVRLVFHYRAQEKSASIVKTSLRMNRLVLAAIDLMFLVIREHAKRWVMLLMVCIAASGNLFLS
jgi:hypothetical protein